MFSTLLRNLPLIRTRFYLLGLQWRTTMWLQTLNNIKVVLEKTTILWASYSCLNCFFTQVIGTSSKWGTKCPVIIWEQLNNFTFSRKLILQNILNLKKINFSCVIAMNSVITKTIMWYLHWFQILCWHEFYQLDSISLSKMKLISIYHNYKCFHISQIFILSYCTQKLKVS